MGNDTIRGINSASFMSLLLGGAALAGLIPAPAAADTTGTVQVASLETVTVTATRRAEKITDVPYNISAVSGDKIELLHVLDASELMREVPGVSVVDRGDRNAAVISGIRIRGLNVDSSALGDYAVGAAATVSTYVGDTPIFANFLLDDINRVEVLRGPQGTLYGSNALGGTVRYILNEPDFDTFGGTVRVSVSHAEPSAGIGLSGSATINIPIDDTLALRADRHAARRRPHRFGLAQLQPQSQDRLHAERGR